MKVKIDVGMRGGGDYRIWLDDVEISRDTTAFVVRADAADIAPPLLEIVLMPESVEISGDVELLLERAKLDDP
jgi:hypothetical protein